MGPESQDPILTQGAYRGSTAGGSDARSHLLDLLRLRASKARASLQGNPTHPSSPPQGPVGPLNTPLDHPRTPSRAVLSRYKPRQIIITGQPVLISTGILLPVKHTGTT